tara:strand:+ start:413 stop:856 length:444 start_codon:yes stop_codon:yes gene_type:complete
MKIPLVKTTLFIAYVLSYLVLLGCAGQTSLNQQLQDKLVERIERRWEFYAAKDYAGAWDLSTPEYRKIFPRESYYKNFHGLLELELTGVRLLAYDARAAVASVAVRVMISPRPGAPAASLALGKSPTTIDETWKLVDGNWYYVDRVK